MLWDKKPTVRPVYLKKLSNLWDPSSITVDDRATFPAGPHTFMNRRTL